jgi:hypothetical protein
MSMYRVNERVKQHRLSPALVIAGVGLGIFAIEIWAILNVFNWAIEIGMKLFGSTVVGGN